MQGVKVRDGTKILTNNKALVSDNFAKGLSNILKGLDYADDLIILDENISKTNEFLEVLRVQGAKTGSKINVKKIKLLRLEISKGEEVMLGNEKIGQVNSFACLGYQ